MATDPTLMDDEVKEIFRLVYGGGVTSANERAAAEHLARRFTSGPELSTRLWGEGSEQRERIIDYLRGEYRKGTGFGETPGYPPNRVASTLRTWYEQGPTEGLSGDPSYVARRLAVTEAAFYTQALDNAVDEELEANGFIDGYEILLAPERDDWDCDCEMHADNSPYETLDETPEPPFHPLCQCRRRPMILSKKKKRERPKRDIRAEMAERGFDPVDIIKYAVVNTAKRKVRQVIQDQVINLVKAILYTPQGALLRQMTREIAQHYVQVGRETMRHIWGRIVRRPVTSVAPVGQAQVETATRMRELTEQAASLAGRKMPPKARPADWTPPDPVEFQREVREVMKEAVRGGKVHRGPVTYRDPGVRTMTRDDIINQLFTSPGPVVKITPETLTVWKKGGVIDTGRTGIGVPPSPIPGQVAPAQVAAMGTTEALPTVIRVWPVTAVTVEDLGLAPDEVILPPGVTLRPFALSLEDGEFVVDFREMPTWSASSPRVTADEVAPYLVEPTWAPVEAQAANYSRIFPVPPAQLLEHMTFGMGLTDPKIFVDAHKASGEVQIVIEADGFIAIRNFRQATNGIEVEHDQINISAEAQGQGLGTAFITNSIYLYESLGFRTVKLHAEGDADFVGSYVWARFGFTPTITSWARIRREADVWFQANRSKLTPVELGELSMAISITHPRGIWTLAAQRVGREILAGKAMSWTGYLDLTDQDQMQRFNAYTRRLPLVQTPEVDQLPSRVTSFRFARPGDPNPLPQGVASADRDLWEELRVTLAPGASTDPAVLVEQWKSVFGTRTDSLNPRQLRAYMNNALSGDLVHTRIEGIVAAGMNDAGTMSYVDFLVGQAMDGNPEGVIRIWRDPGSPSPMVALAWQGFLPTAQLDTTAAATMQGVGQSLRGIEVAIAARVGDLAVRSTTYALVRTPEELANALSQGFMMQLSGRTDSGTGHSMVQFEDELHEWIENAYNETERTGLVQGNAYNALDGFYNTEVAAPQLDISGVFFYAGRLIQNARIAVPQPILDALASVDGITVMLPGPIGGMGAQFNAINATGPTAFDALVWFDEDMRFRLSMPESQFTRDRRAAEAAAQAAAQAAATPPAPAPPAPAPAAPTYPPLPAGADEAVPLFTGGAPAAVGGEPTLAELRAMQAEWGTTAATPTDLKAAFGRDFSDGEAAAWNDRVNMTGPQFVEWFTAHVPTELIGKPSWQIRISDDDLEFGLETTADPNVGIKVRFSRSVDFDASSVYHAYMVVSPSGQVPGIGKAYFRAFVALYEHWGIDRITVSAGLSVGGYAWARFGFLPDDPGDAQRFAEQLLANKFGDWDDVAQRLVQTEQFRIDEVDRRTTISVAEEFPVSTFDADDLHSFSDARLRELHDEIVAAYTADDFRLHSSHPIPAHFNDEEAFRVMWDADRHDVEIDVIDELVQDAQERETWEEDNANQWGLALYNSGDPALMWEIADTPEGKSLLMGQGWSGYLELSSYEQRQRLDGYIRYGEARPDMFEAATRLAGVQTFVRSVDPALLLAAGQPPAAVQAAVAWEPMVRPRVPYPDQWAPIPPDIEPLIVEQARLWGWDRIDGDPTSRRAMQAIEESATAFGRGLPRTFRTLPNDLLDYARATPSLPAELQLAVTPTIAARAEPRGFVVNVTMDAQLPAQLRDEPFGGTFARTDPSAQVGIQAVYRAGSPTEVELRLRATGRAGLDVQQWVEILGHWYTLAERVENRANIAVTLNPASAFAHALVQPGIAPTAGMAYADAHRRPVGDPVRTRTATAIGSFLLGVDVYETSVASITRLMGRHQDSSRSEPVGPLLRALVDEGVIEVGMYAMVKDAFDVGNDAAVRREFESLQRVGQVRVLGELALTAGEYPGALVYLSDDGVKNLPRGKPPALTDTEDPSARPTYISSPQDGWNQALAGLDTSAFGAFRNRMLALSRRAPSNIIDNPKVWLSNDYGAIVNTEPYGPVVEDRIRRLLGAGDPDERRVARVMAMLIDHEDVQRIGGHERWRLGILNTDERSSFISALVNVGHEQGTGNITASLTRRIDNGRLSPTMEISLGGHPLSRSSGPVSVMREIQAIAPLLDTSMWRDVVAFDAVLTNQRITEPHVLRLFLNHGATLSTGEWERILLRMEEITTALPSFEITQEGRRRVLEATNTSMQAVHGVGGQTDIVRPDIDPTAAAIFARAVESLGGAHVTLDLVGPGVDSLRSALRVVVREPHQAVGYLDASTSAMSDSGLLLEAHEMPIPLHRGERADLTLLRDDDTALRYASSIAARLGWRLSSTGGGQGVTTYTIRDGSGEVLTAWMVRRDTSPTAAWLTFANPYTGRDVFRLTEINQYGSTSGLGYQIEGLAGASTRLQEVLGVFEAPTAYEDMILGMAYLNRSWAVRSGDAIGGPSGSRVNRDEFRLPTGFSAATDAVSRLLRPRAATAATAAPRVTQHPVSQAYQDAFDQIEQALTPQHGNSYAPARIRPVTELGIGGIDDLVRLAEGVTGQPAMATWNAPGDRQQTFVPREVAEALVEASGIVDTLVPHNPHETRDEILSGLVREWQTSIKDPPGVFMYLTLTRDPDSAFVPGPIFLNLEKLAHGNDLEPGYTMAPGGPSYLDPGTQAIGDRLTQSQDGYDPTGRFNVDQSITGVAIHEYGHAVTVEVLTELMRLRRHPAPLRRFASPEQRDAYFALQDFLDDAKAAVVGLDPDVVRSVFPSGYPYDVAKDLAYVVQPQDILTVEDMVAAESLAEATVGLMMDAPRFRSEYPKLARLTEMVFDLAASNKGLASIQWPAPGEVYRLTRGLQAPADIRSHPVVGHYVPGDDLRRPAWSHSTFTLDAFERAVETVTGQVDDQIQYVVGLLPDGQALPAPMQFVAAPMPDRRPPALFRPTAGEPIMHAARDPAALRGWEQGRFIPRTPPGTFDADAVADRFDEFAEQLKDMTAPGGVAMVTIPVDPTVRPGANIQWDPLGGAETPWEELQRYRRIFGHAEIFDREFGLMTIVASNDQAALQDFIHHAQEARYRAIYLANQGGPTRQHYPFRRPGDERPEFPVTQGTPAVDERYGIDVWRDTFDDQTYPVLYHGTTIERGLKIREEGLVPQTGDLSAWAYGEYDMLPPREVIGGWPLEAFPERERSIIESGRYFVGLPEVDGQRRTFPITHIGTGGWPTATGQMTMPDGSIRNTREYVYNDEIATVRFETQGAMLTPVMELREGWVKWLEDADPDLMYRGMSWEEWEWVQRMGYIQSLGDMNIGDGQRGLTYFATDAGTAASYASSFAPLQYAAAPAKPGVVVAVPRREGVDVPGTGENEIGIKDRIPLTEIAKVWEGHTYQSSAGMFDIRDEGVDKLKLTPGSAMPPVDAVAWHESSLEQTPVLRLPDTETTSPPVAFLTSADEIDRAVVAIRSHLEWKLGRKVTWDDVAQHGAMVAFSDYEPGDVFRYQHDGTVIDATEGLGSTPDALPVNVEPDDWFVYKPTPGTDLLTGARLMRFLMDRSPEYGREIEIALGQGELFPRGLTANLHRFVRNVREAEPEIPRVELRGKVLAEAVAEAGMTPLSYVDTPIGPSVFQADVPVGTRVVTLDQVRRMERYMVPQLPAELANAYSPQVLAAVLRYQAIAMQPGYSILDGVVLEAGRASALISGTPEALERVRAAHDDISFMYLSYRRGRR